MTENKTRFWVRSCSSIAMRTTEWEGFHDSAREEHGSNPGAARGFRRERFRRYPQVDVRRQFVARLSHRGQGNSISAEDPYAAGGCGSLLWVHGGGGNGRSGAEGLVHEHSGSDLH